MTIRYYLPAKIHCANHTLLVVEIYIDWHIVRDYIYHIANRTKYKSKQNNTSIHFITSITLVYYIKYCCFKNSYNENSKKKVLKVKIENNGYTNNI